MVKLFKNRFSWISGRQNSGYLKITILESQIFKFDISLLKFPEGSYIPDHTDPAIAGYRHYRCNIILKKSKSGGEFLSERNIINWTRLKFFRPDLSTHSVTKVVGGSRIVLSIGFLLKNK